MSPTRIANPGSAGSLASVSFARSSATVPSFRYIWIERRAGLNDPNQGRADLQELVHRSRMSS
jgi:hypothetical protein